MNGAELIAAERQRQIDEEGWSEHHDDRHCLEELARAAACYALPYDVRELRVLKWQLGHLLWPWDRGWWKSKVRPGLEGNESVHARMRDLEKAGALIAAELDRYQRMLETVGDAHG